MTVAKNTVFSVLAFMAMALIMTMALAGPTWAYGEVPENFQDRLRFLYGIGPDIAGYYELQDEFEPTAGNINKITSDLQTTAFRFAKVVVLGRYKNTIAVFIKEHNQVVVNKYGQNTENGLNIAKLLNDISYIVTIETLYSEFKENNVEATIKYNHAFICVIGTLKSLGKEPIIDLNTSMSSYRYYAMLNLNDPMGKSPVVKVYLDESNLETISEASPGDTILLESTVDEFSDNGFILNNESGGFYKLTLEELSELGF